MGQAPALHPASDLGSIPNAPLSPQTEQGVIFAYN